VVPGRRGCWWRASAPTARTAQPPRPADSPITAIAARIAALRLDPAAAVARCDAQPLLETAGGLVVTGPTGTNVADLRIVLARP